MAVLLALASHSGSWTGEVHSALELDVSLGVVMVGFSAGVVVASPPPALLASGVTVTVTVAGHVSAV